MKSFVPHYTLETPKNFQDALQFMSTGKYRPFAGGTDLMVLLEAGKLKHQNFIDLWSLKELRYIHVEEAFIRIGAMTTYSDLRDHPVIQKEFPLLVEAAKQTGAIAIQNRGTIGGNIANASPAADTPPALLVLDTQIRVCSQKNERRISYEKFHHDYKKMDLNQDELIQEIKILRNTKNKHTYYRKVGTRRAQAISKICAAGTAEMQNGLIQDFKWAMGAVAPIPLRCKKTEAFLINKKLTKDVIQSAVAILGSEISPIDDIRSHSTYRRQVAQNLLQHWLHELARTST